MARGWESKSVESQQADRESTGTAKGAATPEESVRLARRRTLELSRARALADLQVACRPAHRQMLEAAIADIEKQLEAFR